MTYLDWKVKRQSMQTFFSSDKVVLISDKVDFGAKKVSRDKEVHYIITEGSIH